MDDLISRQAALNDLAAFILDEIWDEELWELNWRAFPEIICRKMVRLGYVKRTEEGYERLPMPTVEPSVVTMKLKVDAEDVKKAMQDAELTLLPAEPRKGKWERHYSRPNVYADLFWHCSECGYKNDENYAPVYHHFCPNCGARMEESEESDGKI